MDSIVLVGKLVLERLLSYMEQMQEELTQHMRLYINEQEYNNIKQ